MSTSKDASNVTASTSQDTCMVSNSQDLPVIEEVMISTEVAKLVPFVPTTRSDDGDYGKLRTKQFPTPPKNKHIFTYYGTQANLGTENFEEVLHECSDEEHGNSCVCKLVSTYVGEDGVEGGEDGSEGGEDGSEGGEQRSKVGQNAISSAPQILRVNISSIQQSVQTDNNELHYSSIYIKQVNTTQIMNSADEHTDEITVPQDSEYIKDRSVIDNTAQISLVPEE